MCSKYLEIVKEQRTQKLVNPKLKSAFVTLILLCQMHTFWYRATENHVRAQIHPVWAIDDTQLMII